MEIDSPKKSLRKTWIKFLLKSKYKDLFSDDKSLEIQKNSSKKKIIFNKE